jgi:uncharacterized protein (DUF1684 family)
MAAFGADPSVALRTPMRTMARAVGSLFLVLALSPSSCRSKAPDASEDAKWRAAVETFRAERAQAIGGEDGWITLVGLFWLKPGENTIGSDPTSDAVLPADRSPRRAGVITVDGQRAQFQAAPGADVRHDGAPLSPLLLEDDSSARATVLELGTLRMHIIRRQGRLALRVKDRDHPRLPDFKGLTWFPVNPAWRIRARFEPAPEGSTVPIVNVLGQSEGQSMPGHLTLRIEGAAYRLVALKDEGPGFFVVFRDQTAGHGTYPGGRFLETSPPDAEGNVELDFNRAYSPPCAFTAFATCPLPPSDNALPIAITAGETYSGPH